MHKDLISKFVTQPGNPDIPSTSVALRLELLARANFADYRKLVPQTLFRLLAICLRIRCTVDGQNSDGHRELTGRMFARDLRMEK